MRNWSPAEALPAITARGRSPLTITEGISWLLQAPKMLEPHHCFHDDRLAQAWQQ